MNQDKLHKYMDSMMNAQENMVIQMYGNISLNYLITFPLQLLLIVKYIIKLINHSFSVFMEVLVHQSITWIILDNLIDFKKFHMKDLCVIFYGVILMIDLVGVYHQEVLDTHLV